MGFEDEIARQSRQTAAPKAASLPGWHETLLRELEKAQVPKVAAFTCPGDEVRSRLWRPDARERRYVPIEAGWVLHYMAEYRESYLVSGRFFVSPSCLSNCFRWATNAKIFKAQGGSIGNRVPPHVQITRGLPGGGGWDVTPSTSGDFHSDLGAARVVAILRGGGRLASGEHGSFRTTPM